MGKISDRLASKGHPFYAVSKELFKDYRRYWAMLDEVYAENNDSDEDSELSDSAEEYYRGIVKRMEDVLKKSSGPDFIKWLEFINLHSAGVAESEDVLDSFMTDWSHLAIAGEGSSPHRSGFLVALPIRMRGKKLAWQLDIPENKHQGLSDVLRKYDFLDEDSVIRFMPRLISVNESLFLDFRTIYHIRQAFIRKNPREAYRLMLERRMLAGAGLPDLSLPPDPDNHTMGLLVAYVESDDLHEALPVENQLRRLQGDEDDGEEGSPRFNKLEYNSSISDVFDICEKMGRDLTKLFDGVDLSPTQQLQPIYTARVEAAQDERRFYWMAQLAENGWRADDVKNLSIINNFTMVQDNNEIILTVRDSRDPSRESKIHWMKILGESLESSLDALMRTAVIMGIKLEKSTSETK